MRIFRKQYSFIHSLYFRRNFNLRSGTLLSVFLISMISLLSALTRPLSESQQEGQEQAPIRGKVISIPSGEGVDGGNITRFEPHNGERKIQARAAAEVIYITRKSSEQIYFAENSRRAISMKKAVPAESVKKGYGNKPSKTISSAGSDPKYNRSKQNKTKPIMKSKTINSSTKKVSKYQKNVSFDKASASINSSNPLRGEKPKLEVLKGKDDSSKLSPVRTNDIIPHLARETIPRTIQYYAQPPWLSDRDIRIMRLLSEGVVQRRIGLSQNRSTEYLLYLANSTEDGTHLSNNSVSVRIRTCVDAVSLSCKDWSRVLSYHLDRIVGLNRIVPTAGRYVTELYSTAIKEGTTETAVWFPADLPARQYGDDSLEATRYVKKKFWRFSDRQKWSLLDECAKNVEGEKARMAVFLFLLQVSTFYGRA